MLRSTKNVIEKVVAQKRSLERRAPASDNDERLGKEVQLPNLEDKEIFCYRYINRCNEGLVILGCDMDAVDQYYAIKRYDATKITNLDPIVLDAYKLRTLRHRNLLSLFDCFVQDTFIYYTFPCSDLGSVKDIIRSYYRYGVPERAMAGIFTQILDAVAYLHSKRIIHRDIRPHHILVNMDGVAKLSGLRNMLQMPTGVTKVNEYTEEMAVAMCYLAPEVLEQDYNGYGLQSDVFMLGMTLCESVNGVLALNEQSSFEILYRKLKNNTPRPIDCITVVENEACGIDCSQYPSDYRSREFSGPLHGFIHVCLKRNPLERPTSAELKLTQWIEMTANKDFFKPADVIKSLRFDESHRFSTFPDIFDRKKFDTD